MAAFGAPSSAFNLIKFFYSCPRKSENAAISITVDKNSNILQMAEAIVHADVMSPRPLLAWMAKLKD